MTAPLFFTSERKEIKVLYLLGIKERLKSIDFSKKRLNFARKAKNTYGKNHP